MNQTKTQQTHCRILGGDHLLASQIKMETTFICDQLFYLHIETIPLLGDDPKPRIKK